MEHRKVYKSYITARVDYIEQYWFYAGWLMTPFLSLKTYFDSRCWQAWVKKLSQIKQEYVFLSLEGIKGKNIATDSLKLTEKYLCSTKI